MTRLFVAAWPSTDVKERLRNLPTLAEAGVRPVPPANWHVTLRFLGDASAAEAETLLSGATLPRATVTLGPRVERLGHGQLVIPAAGVDELAAAVTLATTDIGEPAQHRFRGHLTVARTKRDARSALFGLPFRATMSVGEIALVASTLESAGARYETVATFPTI